MKKARVVRAFSLMGSCAVLTSKRRCLIGARPCLFAEVGGSVEEVFAGALGVD